MHAPKGLTQAPYKSQRDNKLPPWVIRELNLEVHAPMHGISVPLRSLRLYFRP